MRRKSKGKGVSQFMCENVGSGVHAALPLPIEDLAS